MNVGHSLSFRMEALARALLGEPASRDGHTWRYGSQGSLAIEVGGPKRGAWFSHEDSEGGGPVKLIMRALECDAAGARAWAELWLANDATDNPPEPASEPERGPDNEAAEKDEKKRQQALNILRGCAPATEGTPTARYIRNRGYSRPIPETIRHNSDLVWGNQGGLPGMVAAVQDAAGRAIAIHRTWLEEDGRKATWTKDPRRMLGSPTGGAVRLSPPGPVAVVGEGIETMLAITEARPDLFCLAALSTSGLVNLELPNGIEEVIICADNDRSGAGLKAAHAAARKFVGQGIKVSIALPPGPAFGTKGRDFNDVLMDGGPDAVRALIENAELWVQERVSTNRQALPLKEVERRMEEALDEFMGRVAEWHTTNRDNRGDEPVMALKVTPGAGKSTQAGLAVAKLARVLGGMKVRSQIMRRDKTDDDGMTVPKPICVDFFVSNYEQAEELKARLYRDVALRKAMDFSPENWRRPASIRIMRSRHQTDPETGEPMCDRQDVVKGVTALGLPLSSTLCRRRATPEEALSEKPTVGVAPDRKCPSYDTCPSIRQMTAHWDIRIFTHSYLIHEPKPFALKDREKPDLVVVDESFLQCLEQKEVFNAEILTRPETFHAKPENNDRLVEVNRLVLEALDKGIPVLKHLRANGITAHVAAGQTEEGEPSSLAAIARALPHGIKPGSAEDQRRLLPRLENQHCRRVAFMWEVLAAELALAPERSETHCVSQYVNPNDGARKIKVCHRLDLRDLCRGVPTLILDADVNERFLGKLWPDSEMVRLDARRNAVVVQVCDRRFGGQLKRDNEEGERFRREVEEVFTGLERVVQGPVLLAGELKVIGDAKLGKKPKFQLPEHWTVAHFGGLKGLNRYEDHDVAVLLGRCQASIPNMEDMAQALYWDDPEPIVRLKKDELLGSDWREYRMTDGSVVGREFRNVVHPDPRVQELIELIREQEGEQAIDRVRPVRAPADRLKTIFVFCDLPLPSMEVYRLVTWNELLIVARVSEALRKWGGVLPLTAGWIADHEPVMLTPDAKGRPTERAVIKAQKTLGLADRKGELPLIYYLLGEVHLFLAAYRTPGQRGRDRLALVDPKCPDPKRALEGALGQEVLALRRLEDTAEPVPEQAPEAPSEPLPEPAPVEPVREPVAPVAPVPPPEPSPAPEPELVQMLDFSRFPGQADPEADAARMFQNPGWRASSSNWYRQAWPQSEPSTDARMLSAGCNRQKRPGYLDFSDAPRQADPDAPRMLDFSQAPRQIDIELMDRWFEAEFAGARPVIPTDLLDFSNAPRQWPDGQYARLHAEDWSSFPYWDRRTSCRVDKTAENSAFKSN